jgi:hypothetical protein
MSWQTLPPANLTQEGGYVPIPLAGAGGRLPLQIPPFPMEDTGLYEVGIYDLPQGGPAGLVSVPQTAQIARYTRSLVFEVPPNITAPHVGLRLISHEEVETASYLIACKWQMPYGSGTGDGGGTPVPSGFVAAISWQEIKSAAIAEIAQGYATIESVTTGLSEVQEAIDALAAQNSINSATQQAIAAITTRVLALESSDPEQVEAIATLQQAIADLVAEGDSGDAGQSSLFSAQDVFDFTLGYSSLEQDSEIPRIANKLKARFPALADTDIEGLSGEVAIGGSEYPLYSQLIQIIGNTSPAEEIELERAARAISAVKFGTALSNINNLYGSIRDSVEFPPSPFYYKKLTDELLFPAQEMAPDQWVSISIPRYKSYIKQVEVRAGIQGTLVHARVKLQRFGQALETAYSGSAYANFLTVYFGVELAIDEEVEILILELMIEDQQTLYPRIRLHYRHSLY